MLEIVLIAPYVNFETACKWAENYKACEDCKFIGPLTMNDKQFLLFKVNYPCKDVVQYVSDIISIDGEYYRISEF